MSTISSTNQCFPRSEAQTQTSVDLILSDIFRLTLSSSVLNCYHTIEITISHSEFQRFLKLSFEKLITNHKQKHQMILAPLRTSGISSVWQIILCISSVCPSLDPHTIICRRYPFILTIKNLSCLTAYPLCFVELSLERISKATNNFTSEFLSVQRCKIRG